MSQKTPRAASLWVISQPCYLHVHTQSIVDLCAAWGRVLQKMPSPSNQEPTHSLIYWPLILWSIPSVPEVSPARRLWAHASNPNKKHRARGTPWAQVCSRSKELGANIPIRLLRVSPEGCSSQKHKHLPASAVLRQLWLNGREERVRAILGLAWSPSLSPATSSPFCSQIFFSCGFLFLYVTSEAFVNSSL